jgi:hypothetical protein
MDELVPMSKELQAVIERTKMAMASAFIGSCKVKASRKPAALAPPPQT